MQNTELENNLAAQLAQLSTRFANAAYYAQALKTHSLQGSHAWANLQQFLNILSYYGHGTFSAAKAYAASRRA